MQQTNWKQTNRKQTNWYVIQVLTGSEQAICRDLKEFLDRELYEHCFVPMAERQRRKEGKYVTLREPLFPGYLFIVSDYIEDINAALWKIAKFKTDSSYWYCLRTTASGGGNRLLFPDR
jgi:transcription antitermination factor NusG